MHLCKLSVGLEKLNINLIKMSVLENNDIVLWSACVLQVTLWMHLGG